MTTRSRSGYGRSFFYVLSIDRLSVAGAWGWQRESAALYAGQCDVAFMQWVEIVVEAVEVVTTATLVKDELEPLDIFWVTAVGVTGESWVFQNDPLGVLVRGHAAVVPWQGAVRRV